MERAISEMEKIRRAEEIYSKRKNGEYTYSLADENKVKIKSLYKILFQLLFLFNIAIIIVAIQNKNYIFTKDFLNEANKYNIDTENVELASNQLYYNTILETINYQFDMLQAAMQRQ